jgi:hypothetical protein
VWHIWGRKKQKITAPARKQIKEDENWPILNEAAFRFLISNLGLRAPFES